MKKILFILSFISLAEKIPAQEYVDQSATYSLSERQHGDIANVNLVTWRRYVFTNDDALQKHIDSIPGNKIGNIRLAPRDLGKLLVIIVKIQ
jgi:hypothetical protein